MIGFYPFSVVIVMLTVIPNASNHLLFANPMVQVSPTCGPPDPGFNVYINATGFPHNSNVNWKLVDSNGKIPLYGYFHSNDTGSFNDGTYLDDLTEGTYKLYFGTDSNNDNKFDVGLPTAYVNLTAPCTSPQNQTPIPSQSLLQRPTPNSNNIQSGNWLDICQNIQAWLIDSCGTYVNPDGQLTLEGVRVKNCIIYSSLLNALDSQELSPNIILELLEQGVGLPTDCTNVVKTGIIQNITQ